MSPLSINQKKKIRSLGRKKFRNELGLFLVEGDKMLRELLAPGPGCLPYRVEMLVATGDWLAAFGESIPGGIETVEVGPAELRQVSLQQEPNRAIALVQQLKYTPDVSLLAQDLCIGLENIQDPGNLGAILRIADWFGIRDILCSPDCVELYNPKVIQSTMGSFLRVRVHYLDLPGMIGRIREEVLPGLDEGNGRPGTEAGYPVYATGSQGENLYEGKLPAHGMILLGNESKGLSHPLLELCDRVISIPRQDPSLHPESLNVAAATAILCAEFRRQSG